ncbi:MAG TPA: TetR/AcrR family transcriptional regulator [Microlunatus sp.]|nr:TetR/AcrR family transcriptional regulator [Microlunatus sp.]
MPRPRFGKLPEDQQRTILRVALAEFARYGYAGASLNRIIEAAGISKGSLYYYFDGKEDLYAHVARCELTALIEREGPFEVPDTPDPEAYWSVLSNHYLRLMRALLADAVLAGLVRGWIADPGDPALAGVGRDLERTGLPWFTSVLSTGQRIGAVRTDLPQELLLAVVFAMGQAIDVWLTGAAADSDSDRSIDDLVPALLGLIRRALQP